MKTCTISGCDRKHYGKGLCNAHYLRKRNTGSPEGSGKALRGEGRKFLDKVKLLRTNECVLWPFGQNGDGYGVLWCNSRPHRAHRLVCREVNGPPPFRRAHAAHTCGNRDCVNPQHIRWATHSENMQDKKIHGTDWHPRGDDHPNVKVPAAAIPLIISDERANKAVAEEYGVSASLIQKIRIGKARTK